MPAMLDGPDTALVRRNLWLRVPPLAFIDAGAGRPGGRLQPDFEAGSTPAGVSDIFRCSSAGESTCLKSRGPLVRFQPPELAIVPHERSVQTADWVQHHTVTVEESVQIRQLVAAATCTRANCVHDVAAACYLAMVDVRVQLPLDALGDRTQWQELTNWSSSIPNRTSRVRFPSASAAHNPRRRETQAQATCTVAQLRM